ncbi:biopolymer transporter ExbD [Gloeocapsa sp. PCC 73106]|uniref:ExbD/TolR family protein n=1 Tax=Gloeocapsa sp. PCC 73106 TaxID=102232 RepID=UPI0002AC3134|nr:biopolymer transporter ExbD [Gloeocapsa sp. PCC 73106]ELR96759.1 biopolymer transport protein [Gloeocapsa sp. PCC 73106]
MRLPEEPELDDGINIVPMIDVIFSILAFFIVSSLYLIRSEGLPVNLPSATTTESVKKEQINVTIESDGDIFLNREPIQVEALPSALRALVQKGDEALVVINADTEIEHGRVVEVMDQLRQVEGVNLAIAAKKIEQK